MGFVSDIALVTSLFFSCTLTHQISHLFQRILPFKHTPQSMSTPDNLIYRHSVGAHSPPF